MENDCIKSIIARSSIRAYTSEKLTQDELFTLADCALCAPTAKGLCTQRIYFVTCKELIAQIEREVAVAIEAAKETDLLERLRARGGKILYDAPLFAVIAVDKTTRYHDIDAGIVVQTLALAAKSLGLDSVILGMPEWAFIGKQREYFKSRLGIPQELEYGIGIAIGHAAADKAPHECDTTHVIYVDD